MPVSETLLGQSFDLLEAKSHLDHRRPPAV